jgi:formylmethanofuran--tetrahydromethanopterin N-formyltransferase
MLKKIVEKSVVPDGVNSIYEIVFNGMTPTLLKRATARGIRAAASVPGVKRITAVNFGGKLGPIRVNLKEALETQHEA